MSFLAGGLRLVSCAREGRCGDREYQAEGENRYQGFMDVSSMDVS
jgi:hypothetical protein